MRASDLVPSRLRPAARRLKMAVLTAVFGRTGAKERGELRFWRDLVRQQTGPADYERSFTEPFGLRREDFAGKRVLDVGCGPLGTLEWADVAAERVGLDPLVDEYRDLGIDRHAMEYVDASAESMPFPADRFDVVATLNALDHVADVEASIEEIVRVTAPGGLILLMVEIGHAPRIEEPHELSGEVIGAFERTCDVELLRYLEIVHPDDLHRSLRAGRDITREQAHAGRPSLLVARMRKRG